MTDKIAVVTGGSQGLGFAIAAELKSAGYHVVIFGRRQDVLDDAVARLGGGASAISVDIGSLAAVDAAFAEIDRLPGTLSVLVNNAGVFIPAPIDEADDDVINQTISTNLVGTIACTRAAIKRMKQAGTGDVINVTSEGASFAFPLLSVYCASKAGVEQFTRVLNSELRKTDIRIMTARVGAMRTEGASNAYNNKFAARFGEAALESGAVFRAGQGMDPASPARTIVATLATARDAKPAMIDINSA